MAAPGATNRANYALNQGAGILSVAWGPDPSTVELTTTTLAFGVPYLLTVNHVTDRAAAANVILPGSQIGFTPYEYTPADVGTPGIPGQTVYVPGGYDVTGAGSDIGGTTDQFHFGWEERTGDFDLQVRVARVSVSDPYVHAGLMARESLDPSSPFGAVFASSVQLGCFFESRASLRANSETQAPAGGFPVNYPQTWLRLRRTGQTLAGFASLDGQTWTQLGARVFTGLPARLYFGFAVTSDNAARSATASFRDLGLTVSKTVGAPRLAREPLGPSSRTTGMIISEIMYHPSSRKDGRNLEFVELCNARSIFEDLSGWRLSGDVEFEFPAGFQLEAGEFVVVAASPADIREVYGITNVVGPLRGSLPNDEGRIRLRNNLGAIRLEVNYGTRAPWPVMADGGGHSLVLGRPSYGEDDPRAWGASTLIGGSPGELDAIMPDSLGGVVINEFLAHTDDPEFDFIELYNHSATEADLSGCVLTDDPSMNRYSIPAGTRLPAGGWMAFNQQQLGFALNSGGETIYLIHSNGSRVLDAIHFDAQENGVSSGRSPDGAETVRRLTHSTPGQANARWRSEDIVINEIMYHPISDDDADEYVELHNRGGSPVDLAGWRFVDGIDFAIPGPAILAPGGYLVIARDAERLRSKYAQLQAGNLVGNYGGSLRDSGERIALAMPEPVFSTNRLGDIETNLNYVVVAEVSYRDGGRWGQWADGGGSSLELIDPAADLLQPANWADSDETQKAPWTEATFTGRLDNGQSGYSANRLHILMQGAGECLVDDIEIFRVDSTNVLANGGFEAGPTGWTLQGNHSQSAVVDSGAATGLRCLRVRGLGDGDTGINSIRAPLGAVLNSGVTATIRAKVRWLTGWPEVLFRTRGNWIEMSARMTLPSNLGTPGLPNSRRINNAGPAIYEVNHTPALPRANESVVITCRASDSDGIGQLVVQHRLDPNAALTTVMMRDDGSGGDLVGGDGLYSATIPGRPGGSLVAFRIQATDQASSPGTTLFPADAPVRECLIRWEDPAPFGTFAHYHLWSTRATENARNNALNNTYRDATLVYNHSRVLYNVGFRDKGSPYHGGSGDFAVEVPKDNLLLGARDRVFASTGNGGSEETGLRGQVSAWIGQQMEIPYLHSHYLRLFRNGNQHRNISEDLEQPNNDYAERWFPEDGEGDLYKIAVWFEFQDNNSTFGSVGATLQSFTTTTGLKLARYRWNWQRRPNDGTANNFTNIFDLVTAANDATTNYVSRLLNLADIEQWMRVHAFNRVLGNWDAWTYNVGQNMYAFKQPGARWHLMPWDIDFVLGIGDGASAGLSGGQDPVGNRMYDNTAFRRMLWRAYQDAVAGPMLPERFTPQVSSRRSILLKNNVTGLSNPNGIATYLNQRRTYIMNQIKANDAAAFAITSNNGANFTSTTPTVVLEGTAPFAVADLEVNGTPYPHAWLTYTTFRLQVPLTEVTNVLVLRGRDRRGDILASATDTITVVYRGAIQQPEDYVVLNEIHYNSLEPNASFVELYNRSTSTPFDLTGFRLKGLDYVFGEGAVLPAGGFLMLAKDRAGFQAAYGSTIPVFAEFPGSLDNNGEHLELIQPGVPPEPDIRVSDVQYGSRPPWPTNAAGQGASLQLIDPAQDPYRAGNWTALGTNDANRVTPGRANPVRQSLPAFPLVWINEVLPGNLTSALDNAGEREPWIELYNSGADTIDLSAYYLTDDYTALTQWQFPVGTRISPGEHLLIWADGETQESTASAIHTNFRLHPTRGSVALVRYQGTPVQAAVMDYLDYVLPVPDRSYGSYPDGEPRQRRSFYTSTPRAPNNPAYPEIQVTLNEFLAGNTRVLVDPADGDYEDWIELYNAGTNSLDLSRFTLTDNLTNANLFVFPAGTVIHPKGYLLIWADEEMDQTTTNGDVHANFKLAQTGEQLGLFSPEGVLIDGFAFGPQTNNVSMGRYPDGAELPLLFLESPTPRAPNLIAGGNRPPVLAPVPDQSVAELTELSFILTATDPDPDQELTFGLGTDAPQGADLNPETGRFTWIPSELQGPDAFTFTVQVTDNGTPARIAFQRVTVTVSEVNQPPRMTEIPDQTVDEGSLLSLTASATDPDHPANDLRFSLEPGAPTGAELDPITGAFAWIPTEDQGGRIHQILIRATDNGSPPLSQTTAFTVQVNKVNNPPVFDLIQAQTADELQPWSLTVSAIDPDTPPSVMHYSLDLAPPGAVIDSLTGLIRWTPQEAQGPTNAIFVVRATESDPPYLSASATFSVNVLESNQPPSLASIPDQVLREGDILVVSLSATDPDLPAQKLSFSLDPGSPAGVSVNPDTGLLSWNIDGDQGASTNIIRVRVTDDGPGNLSASQSFAVVIGIQPHVVINEIMHHPPTVNSEYIELFNNSSRTAMDLDDLQLKGRALDYTFSAGTRLLPGQYAVIVRNRAAFAAAYTNQATVLGEYSGQLGSTGDWLRLIHIGSGAESLWDEVQYENSLPWPAAANGQGGSLQLIDPAQDNRRVGNWAAIASQGASLSRSVIVMTNNWRYNSTGADLGSAWRESAYEDSTWPSGQALFYRENAALPAPGLTPLDLGPTTYYFRTRFLWTGTPLGVTLTLQTALDDGAVYYLNGREFF
ncbi:MAG TPA: lamin tail domain-containing protein, partial [Verrucomicrobiota bacterium]|nr:lamin tail domain-containing protein [Verrucomicrobiota bacterium]